MRHAWTMRLRPGRGEDYVALHEAIWPEMSDLLDRAGYRNYTIFMRGDLLVGVFDCDDLEAAKAVLAADPTSARWRDAVAALAENDPDPETGFLPLMRPIFHHAGRTP